jgi:hypothetical protein
MSVQEASTHKSSSFVAGGTLAAGEESYIERAADRELFECLRAGEFGYVLNSRQMGKSSLCVRTMANLAATGARAALVDLSRIGSQTVTAEQWYAGILGEIGRGLGLRGDLLRCWQENLDVAPVARVLAVLRTLVLDRISSPIVIFFDEIDATRSLPFPADEFFAGIRELFNRRAVDPECRHLTFCLLGVAVVSDLVSDPAIAPFNIGRRIQLLDFTREEIAPLAPRIGANGDAILDRIYRWTHGHPFLTQSLCLLAATEGSITGPRELDDLVAHEFLDESALRTNLNLSDVANRVLFERSDSEPDRHRQEVLSLYQRALRRGSIPDDESNPYCAQLKTSGLMRAESGRLAVRNDIYRRVFSHRWIAEHMPRPELRRQRRAYWLGVTRTATVAIVFIAAISYLALGNHRLALLNQAHEREALRQAESTRYTAYVDEMELMQLADQSKNMFALRSQLESTRNSPYRNLEGRYWYGQLHDADRETDWPPGDAHASFSGDGRTLMVRDSEHKETHYYAYPSLKLLRTATWPGEAFLHVGSFRISPDRRQIEFIEAASGNAVGRRRTDNETYLGGRTSDDETACIIYIQNAAGQRLLHVC